jgi:iron(III) transport system substrate-binding protein
MSLLCFILALPAFAQDGRLIEAAKNEGGRVVVYGALEGDTVDAIKKAFRQKAGIELDYWRASATKVMDRALSEHRAGRPLFDVLTLNSSLMASMLKEGIFGKYESPVAKDFPESVIHPSLGPRYFNVLIGIVYNKNVIRPAEVPKSLDDLVKPQYRGKLVMPDPTQHTTTTLWLASLQKLMGKEKADYFIRELGVSKPILVESFLPAAERATTGETPIAIGYIKYVFSFGQRGTPLDYVKLDKMLGDGNYVALGSRAPHPNAGKAFIDFFLRDEGMSILARKGEFVNRKGIQSPLPDADKIQFVELDNLDSKGFAEKKKEYQKIFLR